MINLTENRDRLIFAERQGASAFSPEHIRRVPSDETLMLGGGLNAKALCGADLGWDLESEATLDRVELALKSPNSGPGPSCIPCLRAARLDLADM